MRQFQGPLLPCITIFLIEMHTNNVMAETKDDYFEPNAIERHNGINSSIDLTEISKKGAQLPGTYRTDIYVNGQLVESRDVKFIEKKNTLIAQLNKQDFIRLGLQKNATQAVSALPENTIIEDLGEVVPGGVVNFSFNTQKIDITIPQQFLNSQVRGYVDPAEWNDGINMLFVNYSYTGSQNHYSSSEGQSSSDYLNLRSGINIGPWRFRNYSTWNNNGYDRGWNSINTYLQRDIKFLKSQLIVGESYTPAEVFDSFGFRGVQLLSDDNMQPESLRGYAPVVRGIAQSNAQVTIRQNSNIIWQSWVPPGPFEVKDLYPTSASGDLLVTVKEADGTIRQFVQPFAAVPLMQREGRVKYALTAGEYRDQGQRNTRDNPRFSQFTVLYGLPLTTTLSGGGLIAEDYHAVNIGAGKGLGLLGAFSADVTWAQTNVENQKLNGHQVRLQYAKTLDWTNTTLSVAAYRYSRDFYQFSETQGVYSSLYPPGYKPGNDANEDEIVRESWRGWQDNYRRKNKLQLNLNQSLGEAGSVFITGYEQTYQHVSGSERSLSTGYNVGVNGINYSASYSYSKTPFYDNADNVFSLTVQIPFDRFLPKSWVTASVSGGNNADTTSWLGLTGNAFEDNRLTYAVQQGYADNNTGATGTAFASYKARVAEIQAGYNYSRDGHQYNYGISGGMVAHPYGLTLSQSLGDTMALVKADNASGVKVLNNSGIITDSAGQAIIPYIVPYQRNQIMLDTANTGPDVDIIRDTEFVIPSQGALALATFKTASGARIMMHLSGQQIPFGAVATIKNDSQDVSGIVDTRQRVYISGAPLSGILNVKWESGQCQASYSIPGIGSSIQNVTSVCR